MNNFFYLWLDKIRLEEYDKLRLAKANQSLTL